MCCVCAVGYNIVFFLIGAVKVIGFVVFEVDGKFDGFVFCVLIIIGLFVDLLV